MRDLFNELGEILKHEIIIIKTDDAIIDYIEPVKDYVNPGSAITEKINEQNI